MVKCEQDQLEKETTKKKEEGDKETFKKQERDGRTDEGVSSLYNAVVIRAVL